MAVRIEEAFEVTPVHSDIFQAFSAVYIGPIVLAFPFVFVAMVSVAPAVFLIMGMVSLVQRLRVPQTQTQALIIPFPTRAIEVARRSRAA